MLAEALRQGREQAGLSIAALARQAGVGVATISDIEAGATRNPGILTVRKLAAVLGVSLDALVDYTPMLKDPTPPPAQPLSALLGRTLRAGGGPHDAQ